MGLEKFLDASTGYITYEDSEMLMAYADSVPARVIRHNYGWFISICSLSRCPEHRAFVLKTMREYGYSQSFIDLLKHAAQNDCWWINLDRDGEDVDELEQNEW